MRATKQLINAIAREDVVEVHIEASLGIPLDLSPTASVDQEATQTERVPTLEFCLVEETTEGAVSEEEIVPTHLREVVEGAVGASPQGTPCQVKTFVRKCKRAAEKETDMAEEVAKRSHIETRNEHIHSWIGQVNSLFGHQEYELPEEPISAWDAPRVERVLEEGEVEEMNNSPQTLSLEFATTPPPPVAEPESDWVDDLSGSVPVHPEVNNQTGDRQPDWAEEEEATRNEEEQPVQIEE